MAASWLVRNQHKAYDATSAYWSQLTSIPPLCLATATSLLSAAQTGLALACMLQTWLFWCQLVWTRLTAKEAKAANDIIWAMRMKLWPETTAANVSESSAPCRFALQHQCLPLQHSHCISGCKTCIMLYRPTAQQAYVSMLYWSLAVGHIQPLLRSPAGLRQLPKCPQKKISSAFLRQLLRRRHYLPVGLVQATQALDAGLDAAGALKRAEANGFSLACCGNYPVWGPGRRSIQPGCCARHD
jgi:hypothetical protein